MERRFVVAITRRTSSTIVILSAVVCMAAAFAFGWQPRGARRGTRVRSFAMELMDIDAVSLVLLCSLWALASVAIAIERLPTILHIQAGASSATDLSHLRTERELSDAIVAHASTPLQRPADLHEIRQAIELLPRLQQETRGLLDENARLREEIAQLKSGQQSEPAQ